MRSSDSLARMGARIRGWRENPVQFVYENFKVDLDAWQAEALAQLGGPSNPRRRLAMKACTGPGKSAVLAFIGWHRLACFGEKGEHPKGAALSGEGRDNLRDNLWAELAKWQARSEFLSTAFQWTRERIVAVDHHQTWFLSARSYPKDADADAIGQSLSGLHSRYPFVLLDETGSAPRALGQKATQIFTGAPIDALIAQAGNPTDPSGLLYHACVTERHITIVVTITADPDDPKRTPRVDLEHAREQIQLYGRKNAWVKATILGEFPPAALNALLGVDEVERAMTRHLRDDQFDWAQKRLGIDVARGGGDRTVIFPRQGLASFKPLVLRPQAAHSAISVTIANAAMSAKAKWGSELELIDATGGWAAGAIDVMRANGVQPIDVQFHAPAIDPRYTNRRAEIWFAMAKWVQDGGVLPPERELVAELTTPTYLFHKGKFQLEEKDQVKKRLGRSPDLADALALTFGMVEMPSALSLPGMVGSQQQGKATSDWDPYAEGR